MSGQDDRFARPARLAVPSGAGQSLLAGPAKSAGLERARPCAFAAGSTGPGTDASGRITDGSPSGLSRRGSQAQYVAGSTRSASALLPTARLG